MVALQARQRPVPTIFEHGARSAVHRARPEHRQQSGELLSPEYRRRDEPHAATLPRQPEGYRPERPPLAVSAAWTDWLAHERGLPIAVRAAYRDWESL